jgi:hypothetical protein
MSQKSDTLSQIGKDLLKAVDLADQTLCEELVDAIEKEGSNMTSAKIFQYWDIVGEGPQGFQTTQKNRRNGVGIFGRERHSVGSPMEVSSGDRRERKEQRSERYR